jgi:predicted N-acetyltransferase YhbS
MDDSSLPCRVDYLARHCQHVDCIVDWLHSHWFAPTVGDRERVYQRVQARLGIGTLPVALLALAGAEPVGTVSLVEAEEPLKPGKACFLAALYVPQKWRGKGVGSILCRSAITVAASMGVESLHLSTMDGEGFYRRLGWSKVLDFVTEVHGALEICALMKLSLKPRRDVVRGRGVAGLRAIA